MRDRIFASSLVGPASDMDRRSSIIREIGNDVERGGSASSLTKERSLDGMCTLVQEARSPT
jgi:hypothetical protein